MYGTHAYEPRRRALPTCVLRMRSRAARVWVCCTYGREEKPESIVKRPNGSSMQWQHEYSITATALPTAAAAAAVACYSLALSAHRIGGNFCRVQSNYEKITIYTRLTCSCGGVLVSCVAVMLGCLSNLCTTLGSMRDILGLGWWLEWGVFAHISSSATLAVVGVVVCSHNVLTLRAHAKGCVLFCSHYTATAAAAHKLEHTICGLHMRAYEPCVFERVWFRERESACREQICEHHSAGHLIEDPR